MQAVRQRDRRGGVGLDVAIFDAARMSDTLRLRMFVSRSRCEMGHYVPVMVNEADG